ncbi:unnamed protein product [Oikopleura dioica]|uniref:Protein unc-50 homolog n=1 Tax=Oikopleura dioica TaxID=34765 RepID=E4WQ24_OIKDI|nr:unnamed protein product [Oikopleura dioica]CBY35309.1 unnamed protein product [Oikopleura dioica]
MSTISYAASASIVGSSIQGYRKSDKTSPVLSGAARLHKYLRRIFRKNQMDFEFASWQAFYLLVNPQQVYRNFAYRKQTKNQYARDDPAFLVLISIILTFTAVCFGIVMGLGMKDILELIVWVIVVDFIISGVLIASAMFYLCNKYLRLQPKSHGNELEWAYCFDVHLNATFSLFTILHLAQLFVIKIVLQPLHFSALLGNAFWVLSAASYCYITFLGYSTQPMLQKSTIFLYPMVPIFALFVLSIMINWNWTSNLVYFYQTRL